MSGTSGYPERLVRAKSNYTFLLGKRSPLKRSQSSSKHQGRCTMAKTIQMVMLIDGKEVPVGTCHPGQALILRKNGLAEWDKNHIVLLSKVGIPKPEGNDS